MIGKAKCLLLPSRFIHEKDLLSPLQVYDEIQHPQTEIDFHGKICSRDCSVGENPVEG